MPREMKKILVSLVAVIICAAGVLPDAAAVVIKKAPTVSTQEKSAVDGVGSLVPTVLGLVNGVQQLTKTQRELEGNCVPTSSEITFVNNMVKEWARVGNDTADEFFWRMGSGARRCSGTESYESLVRMGAGTDADVCYDYINDSQMVWHNYPVARVVSYCTDGSYSGCKDKNKKTVSNMYEIFNQIGFVEADYTKQEANQAAKIIARIEECSPAKLSAKKREVWGSFLMDTVSNIGQPTNTGSIMEMVSGVAGSGSIGGAVGNLGSVATQFLMK